MPTAEVDLGDVICTGKGECISGKHPDPPLDKWPLLAWSPGHEVHGKDVFTEDGAASVADIATAACETQNYDALAAKFKTTPDHVGQAVDYAFAAGFLSHGHAAEAHAEEAHHDGESQHADAEHHAAESHAEHADTAHEHEGE